MKKKILLGGLVIASIFGLAVSRYSNDAKITFHKKNTMYPNGIGIAGNTGAPGESTCATCHGASLKVGGTESVFTFKDSLGQTPLDYLPNHTYTITFNYSISGKKGFQVTALTEGNTKAGNLLAGNTTMVTTSVSKQYLNHKNATNSSWTFSWKAPEVNTGKVTFYVAAGNTSSIYSSKYSLSEHTGTGGGTTGLVVNENAFGFFAFYSNDTKNVFMRYTAPTDGKGFVNVVDLQGKSVHYSELGAVKQGVNTKELDLPINIQSGTYVVQLFVNNYFATKQIVVVR